MFGCFYTNSLTKHGNMSYLVHLHVVLCINSVTQQRYQSIHPVCITRTCIILQWLIMRRFMMGNNSKLCCFKFLRYHNSLYFLHRYVHIDFLFEVLQNDRSNRFGLNCEIFFSNFSSACHQFFTFSSPSLNHWSDFNYMNHNYF